MKKIFFSALLITAAFISNAQLTMDAELRFRNIVDHGFMTPVLKGTNPELSFDQRSRLNIGFKSEKYRVYLSLQDARIWGNDNLLSQSGAWGNSHSLGLYQAWVAFKMGNHTTLKIGRQEWNYDNMRLLSSRNWLNALSYDAILLKSEYQNIGLRMDLGLSYNNNSNDMGLLDNSEWPSYKIKTLNFLRIHKRLAENTSATLLSLLSGKSNDSKHILLGTGTHGLLLNYNTAKQSPGGLLSAIELYYQHGADLNRGTNGKHKRISAYYAHAKIGYRTLSKKLQLALGAELISGHDYSNNDENYNNTKHSFDLLYGSRLPYYGGYLNHFTMQDSFLKGTKGGGYFSPYFNAIYKLNSKNSVDVRVHMPQLTTKVKAHTSIDANTGKPTGLDLDTNGNPRYWKGRLGSYFDLLYIHKFTKQLLLKGGLSYADISNIKMQMAYGYADISNKENYKSGINYFTWVMLVFKPKFL